MKIALLGKGKTGGLVRDLHGEKETTIFDRANPVTESKLLGHDIIISFLPAEAFMESLQTLMNSRIPVISGSTGDIPLEKIHQELLEKSLSWIHGNNFSLAMTLLRSMLQKLGKITQLGGFHLSLSETHHSQKLDAPSGTAKSWKEWLGDDSLSIDSLREGDVVGIHSAIAQSTFERVTLTHEALDRKLFAQGALWAAERIHNGSPRRLGLESFQSFVAREINLEETP